MTARPIISVFDSEKANTALATTIPLPTVFSAPIRADIVNFVHSNIAKNRRQAHGVDPRQGHKHSAESWGTGRAVARIPRISGSGTHRSGQGAFGNQCRKGRMFAPLKTWRRWHRRVNIKQKRHAVASALAASAIAPLLLARGHRIQGVAEVPYVFDNKIESYEKTKQVVEFLKRIGAYADVQKVANTKTVRAGQGKFRGKRYSIRKGPLFIVGNENVKLAQAVRNVPGVEIANVNRLNLLQLAPGGQVGRFIIWSESAFRQLNTIFGTFRYSGFQKSGYNLQKPLLSNADISRIINSNEVQSVLKPASSPRVLHLIQKKNPLKNAKALLTLNPYAGVQKTIRKDKIAKALKAKAEKKKAPAATKEQKAARNLRAKNSKKYINSVKARINDIDTKAIEQENIWRDEDTQNNKAKAI